MMRKIFLLGSLLALGVVMAAIAGPTPPTSPPMVGVYRQPINLHKTWKDRGVTVLYGYEPQLDGGGRPTVTVAQWRSSAKAAGLKYICEPSVDLAADNLDPDLAGLLQPQDEPDGKVIERLDANDKVGAEQVYVSLEANYKTWKALAPTKPIWINFDGEQVRWRQTTVDYARMMKACDRCSVDWYPVQRAEDITLYGTILDKTATMAGTKLQMAFVEVSNQNLDPQYYHGHGAPTPSELTQELNLLAQRNVSPAWFPQQLGGFGKGFAYDAVPADLLPVLSGLATSGTPTPVVPVVTSATTKPSMPLSLDGAEIIINNQRYYLRSK